MFKPYLTRTLILLFNFVNLLTVTSQTTDNKEFIGVLNLPDSSMISYKIIFKQMDEQNFEGHSITDFYGTEKTKSIIKGQIDKDKKHISFAESANLSTLSKAKSNEFCYVHVKNANLVTKAGKTIIQGSFQGKYQNDSNCISGKIYLVGTDFLSKDLKQEKANQAEPNQNVMSMLKKTDENKLGSNDQLQVVWESNELVLELWDAAIQDEDKVSIFLNGNIILQDYVISSTRKIISLPLKDKVSELKITAVNEGKSPPNTVNFVLKDNQHHTPVVTNLKIGESTSIFIQKK